MKPIHIADLTRHSRRIDIFPEVPSLVVSVPDHMRHPGSVNELARIEVDREEVSFSLVNRDTAKLHSLPPQGSMVSLYWAHPAEWCHRVMVYLRDTETYDEIQERLLRQSPKAFGEPFRASSGHSGAYPSQASDYGLQRPSTASESNTK